MTREEAIKKLKGSINLLVEVCHFATDSILCEELEDVIKYLEIDLNNAEKLHKWIYNMKRKNRKHNRKHERWRKRTQYNEEARLAWERAVERYALTSE